MSGTASIGGLISGLSTDTIISKMMSYAQQPKDLLAEQKTEAQNELTVWQSLNTRVLALKIKSDSIATSNAFANCKATSTDTNIVNANATTSAMPGTYYLTVNSRAQGHQLASQTFTSTTDDIGTGTMSINFTNDSSKNFTVAVDSTNNSLIGLRDSINRADKGVTASIINSGTSSNPQYQLMLTSASTGEDSIFTVDSGTLTTNISTITQQGANAEIQFGDGANGASPIIVSKSSNTISDLIPGVDLTIGSADPTKMVKIDVQRNTASVSAAVSDFVTQYNDLMDAIDEQFSYDSETGASGVLMGDWNLQKLQMDIVDSVTMPVEGITSQFKTLSSIGITLNTEGHLEIDSDELNEAIENNITDVTRLFASDLQSDSSYISMVSSNADTKPSGTEGWNVNITQAARQAQVTAGTAMAAPLGQDETITVYTSSTKSKQISLTAGMAITDVVKAINEYSAETGVTATATGADGTGTGNYLSLKSLRYGTGRDVFAFSSKSYTVGNTSGLGSATVSVEAAAGESGLGSALAGLDVMGTINGQAATGAGQILTANPSSTDLSTKGLSLMISATSPMSSKVYFTKGLGTSMRDLLLSITSSTGIIGEVQESLNTTIEDIDDKIDDMTESLALYEEQIRTKFDNMESQLAKLQSQGSYLSSQIAAMNK